MSRLDASKNLLDRLRKTVDLTPYTPVPDVPGWLESLSQVASQEPGVLALLGPSGINVSTENGGRSRALPDPTDLFLAGLASHLRGTGQRLSIALPPAGRHLPLLLASAALLASTLDHRQDYNTRVGGVLVVSPDLDVRSRYCDLFVQSMQLDEAHPGSRMRPNGERVMLRPGRLDYDHGVCFFLPPLALPQRICFRPDLIILDLRYAHWVKRAPNLAEWTKKVSGKAGVLALYSLGDEDTLTALIGAGFDDFPFDHAAIAACSERMRKGVVQQKSLTVDWGVAATSSYLTREHTIVRLEQAESIEEHFTNISKILREHRQKDSSELNRARWLLAALSHVPVPLIWYEQAASRFGRSTLRRLITNLGSRNRHDEELGPVLQTLRLLFDTLYDLLERSNPRAEAIRTILPHIMQEVEGHQVLLLVRDRITEQALQTWLGLDAFPREGWLSRVNVRGCPNYADIATQQYKVAIVNGAFPRRYRWITGAALGERVVLIAYDYEIDIIEHQLKAMYDTQVQSFRAQKREKAIQKFGSYHSTSGHESQIPALRLKRPAKRVALSSSSIEEAKPKTTVTSFEELNRALELARRAALQAEEAARAAARAEEEAVHAASLILEDSSDEDVPDDDTEELETNSYLEGIACIKVKIQSQTQGLGTIYIPINEVIECIRQTTPNDILRTTPNKLLPGDVLLRMQEGERASLFDKIVDLAESQPQMQYLATFRRAWREALRDIVARYTTSSRIRYGDILHALQKEGATIESELAVRFWIQDQVIGPESVASIRAVGRLSGSEIIITKATEFDRAFRSIRSIRQSIGRRLNGAIRKSFHNFAEGVPEQTTESLDSRIAIPLEELLETIDLAQVIEIDKQISKVVPTWVDRFRPIV